LIIEIQKETKGVANLILFNFMGQKIMSLDFDIKSGIANELEMPSHITSQLSSGLYYYVFEINGMQMYSGQLMKN
jgi:hypothetical protein